MSEPLVKDGTSPFVLLGTEAEDDVLVTDGLASMAQPLPEIGENVFLGASVKRLTNWNTAANNNEVVWDVAEYDTSNLWNPSIPERFTIPPEWDGHYVTLHLSGIWPGSASLSGYAELKIFRNGDEFNPVGISQDEPAAGNTAPGPCDTRAIPVTAGDFFTAAFRSMSSSFVYAVDDYSPRFAIRSLGQG